MILPISISYTELHPLVDFQFPIRDNDDVGSILHVVAGESSVIFKRSAFEIKPKLGTEYLNSIPLDGLP